MCQATMKNESREGKGLNLMWKGQAGAYHRPDDENYNDFQVFLTFSSKLITELKEGKVVYNNNTILE